MNANCFGALCLYWISWPCCKIGFISLLKNISVLENHHWHAMIGILHESRVFEHVDRNTWQVFDNFYRWLLPIVVQRYPHNLIVDAVCLFCLKLAGHFKICWNIKIFGIWRHFCFWKASISDAKKEIEHSLWFFMADMKLATNFRTKFLISKRIF